MDWTFIYQLCIKTRIVYEEDAKNNPKPSSTTPKPIKNCFKPAPPNPGRNRIKTKRDSQNYDLPDTDNEKKTGKSSQQSKEITFKKIESWFSNVSRKHIMGCVLVSFVVLVVIIVLSLVVSQGDVDEKSMSSTTGPVKGEFPWSLPCEVTKSTSKNKKF